LTGVPTGGFTSGATYTLTLTVLNSTKVAAGFDLHAAAGTLSGAPANTMIMSGNEMHHTQAKTMASGSTSWTFDWTAPAIGSSVVITVSGNAVNNDNMVSGDAWTTSSFTFNQAIAASVNDV
jgi:hypothetical protein